MRICVRESPLDDAEARQRLVRVNRLRNDAIHGADDISSREAQEAISVLHSLLRFDVNGADFGSPRR
jgi:hypothetical protein